MEMYEFIERATTTGEIFIPGALSIADSREKLKEEQILKDVRMFEEVYNQNDPNFESKVSSKDDEIKNELKRLGL